MGQKVHPKANRLGYIKDWDSRWFSLRDMPALIGEDFNIRCFVKERLRMAAVSRIVIERAGSYLRVNIHTARPGIVIGKKGSDIESIRETLEALTGRKVFVNVLEVKQPELDAQLVAEAVAFQLERRINHRRAMKRAIERSLSAGALGVRIRVSGRLGGAEIARKEWLREGRVPLHTFRGDIDYGFTEASTTMGKIGVKVWIFRKEYFSKSREDLLAEVRKQQEQLVPGQAPETMPAPSPSVSPQEKSKPAEASPEPPPEPAPAPAPVEEIAQQSEEMDQDHADA